jgi:hypothetical protein
LFSIKNNETLGEVIEEVAIARFLICWFVFYDKTKFAFVVKEESNEFSNLLNLRFGFKLSSHFARYKFFDSHIMQAW